MCMLSVSSILGRFCSIVHSSVASEELPFFRVHSIRPNRVTKRLLIVSRSHRLGERQLGSVSTHFQYALNRSHVVAEIRLLVVESGDGQFDHSDNVGDMYGRLLLESHSPVVIYRGPIQ